MQRLEMLAFVVFPYVALTVFALGHAWRYLADPYAWNAHSSELLEKRRLYAGSTVFHWGILLTLVGHAGGLLIPQWLFDRVGIDGQLHTRLAVVVGVVVGAMAFVGAALLLWRRITEARVRRHTTLSDWIVLVGLVLVTGLGWFDVLFGHFYVLDTVAPWIRGIVMLDPDPGLMRAVPLTYKLHILAALTLLAVSPFSRLVHIWSAPILYGVRPPLVLRRQGDGVP
jgi:nitrate reductase gamma subunit